MRKLNCWEWMQCGREQGGRKVAELGPCPVALREAADGLNGGKNGGRVCWAIAGTLCRGDVSGSFAEKLGNCMRCDFYDQVMGDWECHFYGPEDIPG